MTRRLIGLVGALLMVASACAAGESTTQAGEPSVLAMPPTTVASSVDSAANSGEATSEGIQVHGHWTIEVRNPDGSVAERREFDNALEQSGAQVLAEILKGDATIVSGDSAVVELLPGGTCADSSTLSHLLAAQQTGPLGAFALAASGIPADFLTGDQPTADYNVSAVRTIVFTESGQLFPDFNPLTCKDISPLAVRQNQSLYVTVEISFS